MTAGSLCEVEAIKASIEELLEQTKSGNASIIATIQKGSHPKSSGILQYLEQAMGLVVTAEILKKTKIGVLINRLKQHEDKNVSELAALIVDNWKQQVTQQNLDMKKKEQELSDTQLAKNIPVKRAYNQEESLAESSDTKRDKVDACSIQTASKNVREPADAKSNKPNSPNEPVSDKLFENITKDPTRNKCMAMLYSGLELAIDELCAPPSKPSPNDEGFPNEPEEDLYVRDELSEMAQRKAVKLESLLYDEHDRIVSTGYKTKFRSKYLNLREKTNPKLRQNLLRGILSCERFMSMTSQEMASDDLRKEMELMERENLLKTRSAKDNAAETDMFQCGRCKQRKCKYYQLQTRSADEPMTTYVTCVNCGNRWKC